MLRLNLKKKGMGCFDVLVLKHGKVLVKLGAIIIKKDPLLNRIFFVDYNGLVFWLRTGVRVSKRACLLLRKLA